MHSLERRRPAPGAPKKNSNPTFKVGVEISAGADPVTASDVSSNSSAAIKEEPTSLDQLHRFASNGYLFALLDATDQILVPHKAKLLGPTKAVSLFTGTANEWHWTVAPYLFQVDSELLDWIAKKLWKEPWGIFAMSKATMEELRLHFKKFLMVKLPDGKQWLFRYYDPRILKAYLPACEPWELQKFFGPIRAYAFTNLDSGQISLVQLPRNDILSSSKPKVYSFSPSVLCSIRPEQLAAFERQAQETFGDRLFQHLKEAHSEALEQLSPDVLRARVRAGIARARQQGFVWESSLTAYVALMFEIAPNFDQHPVIRAILQEDSSDPEARISRLAVDVPDEVWEEAERLSDDADWSARSNEEGS